MEPVAAILHKYPQLVLFLSIVRGDIIGHFHYRARDSAQSWGRRTGRRVGV